jgi:hypothetical protein
MQLEAQSSKLMPKAFLGATVPTQVYAEVGKLLWDAQASDNSPVNSFGSRSFTEEKGSFTEVLCSVELPKTLWDSVSPEQKEVTGS